MDYEKEQQEIECPHCGSDVVAYIDSDYQEVYMEYTNESDSPSYENRMVSEYFCMTCGESFKELGD